MVVKYPSSASWCVRAMSHELAGQESSDNSGSQVHWAVFAVWVCTSHELGGQESPEDVGSPVRWAAFVVSVGVALIAGLFVSPCSVGLVVGTGSLDGESPSGTSNLRCFFKPPAMKTR